jgi:hypothetical protein
VACLLQWSVAECWIPEVANGNGDLHGKAFVLREDGRAAYRTVMKVSALSLSAVRVHAAVLPAEETARAKRAWLLMPPYRAGIIAPALLCRLGNQAAIFDSRAPPILRLATVREMANTESGLVSGEETPAWAQWQRSL